jgi:hypothetical protein
MNGVELSPSNFLLFAAKHYENPSCISIKEFHADLKRIKYIKRLLKRYEKTGQISERLLLNHIILLHNVFNEAVVPILFYKIEKEYWSQLKTFLVFLQYLPDKYEIHNDVIETEISLDTTIIHKLRSI